ncbi:hypothetical protein J132_00977 [Termitomyces sp. J132]|nr:hypothetical protein J132_00977 [Termitomyces sp. J132]
MPYDNIVPAGDDQVMDKHPDFKVALSSAGPSKSVAAQVKLSKLAATKEGVVKSFTKWAGTAKPAVVLIEADNFVVIATLIAFPVNVLQESEAGMIEVLKLRTYVMPGALSQEVRPPVQWDSCDKEFFVTQQS